jgi:phosphatidylserine decarboxylase
MPVLNPINIPLSQCNNLYIIIHAVVAGATPDNSDSWSDDAEGDLSSISPFPSGSPSPWTSVGKKKKKGQLRRISKAAKGDETSQNASNSLEHVINVKNYSLCHRSRLNSKAGINTITHLAVCACQDWKKVDCIVVGNFVTASQAQREWYTEVISMVSSGDYKYKLGVVYFLVFSLSHC